MPRHRHYLLHAMGVRRGLAHSHNHLRHFYATTSHAQNASHHMLGSGLHKMIHHRHKSLIGCGAQRKMEDSRFFDVQSEGDGVRHSRSHRRPKPLQFKM